MPILRKGDNETWLEAGVVLDFSEPSQADLLLGVWEFAISPTSRQCLRQVLEAPSARWAMGSFSIDDSQGDKCIWECVATGTEKVGNSSSNMPSTCKTGVDFNPEPRAGASGFEMEPPDDRLWLC